MYFKATLILILCLTFPDLSLQQRTAKNNNRYNGDIFTPYKEPSNWKAIMIIVVAVLFFGALIYGTSCFYVCKMHFFERTERKYTKMDSTHV